MFKKKKKNAFNTTLCLESVPTNAIFYRAIVQNDEPHVYTSGHLKKENPGKCRDTPTETTFDE